MRLSTLLLMIVFLQACTLHVCGNSEVAHQVGDGQVTEGQAQQDSATADVKADVKP